MTLFKRLLTLLTGTAGGQLILLLSTPVLARMYTPLDFGYFATSVGLAMIFSSVAFFRYDAAILIDDKKTNPVMLLHLSLYLVLISSLIFSIFLVATQDTQFYQSIVPKKLDIFEMIILYLMFSLSGLLTTWHARFNRFSLISASKIILASSVVGFQYFGYRVFGGIGLILGNIGGLLLANGFLLFNILIKDTESVFVRPKFNDLKNCLNAHINFPKYSIFSTLLNGLSNQLPSMLFARSFGAAYAGYYTMSTRFTRGPVGLVGQSIYYVVASHVGKNATDVFEIRNTIESVLSKMSHSAGPVLILGLFMVELIFNLVLGEGWEMAGSMTKILLPWIYVLFLSWPMTSVFNTLGKQKYVLVFNSLFVFAILVPFVFLHWLDRDGVILIMMLFGSLFRFGYIYSALKLVKANANKCIASSVVYWSISVLLLFFNFIR